MQSSATTHHLGRVDELDRAIVAALQLNGRAPWSSIARLSGAGETTVIRRAERLQEAGLLRVIGVVDVLRCGLGVPVLTRLRCRPGHVQDVARAMLPRPETRFLSVISGSADVVAELVVPTHGGLEAVMRDLPALGHVTDTETLAVMQTFISNHDWDARVLDEDAVKALRGDSTLPWEERFWEDPPERLDELELAIVHTLGDDGRMPFNELARAVGASQSTVKRRVDSLVRRGCLRFRTLAEPSVLGYAVELMLWLQVDPKDLDRTGRSLAAHPGTKYLSATTGRFNLVGQIVLGHYGELYRYTTDVVGPLPGVRTADFTLQLSTLKRAWVPTPAARGSHPSSGSKEGQS